MRRRSQSRPLRPSVNQNRNRNRYRSEVTSSTELQSEKSECHLHLLSTPTQGPEEICLSLEHQSPSKTSEKMGYFDRVTVSLHIL